jgi:hypothetical protein
LPDQMKERERDEFVDELEDKALKRFCIHRHVVGSINC